MSEMPEEEKRGKCKEFLCRLLKWLPVFLICASAVWAYYAFVYQYCFVLVNIIAIKVVCLVIYHVILVLFFWSYYQTVTTPLALVPKKFLLPEGVKEELRNVLDYPGYQEATVLILNRFAIQLKTTLNNVSYEGGPRRCEKCVNQCIKPDRTHHCSICKVCILKYDHHCPWVNTCINYANYKFFVLVLLYGFLLCFFMLASTAPYFGAFWFTESLQDVSLATKAHVLCLFFVSILFGSPISCLLGDHLYLIKLNQTTPESTRPPLFSYGADNTAYNLGLRHNFREVFGTSAWLWFFPIFSSPGDGTEFLQKPYAASAMNASSTPHSTPQSNEPTSTPMV